jgi:hypothetical protein
VAKSEAAAFEARDPWGTRVRFTEAA